MTVENNDSMKTKGHEPALTHKLQSQNLIKSFNVSSKVYLPLILWPTSTD